MDMYELFALLMSPNVMGVFVLMCMTAYAFILDLEHRWAIPLAAIPLAVGAEAIPLVVGVGAEAIPFAVGAEAIPLVVGAVPAPSVDVAALAKDVATEKDKLDRVQAVVYQLVGGLFNQDTQSKIMNFHANTLLNRPIDVDDAEADSSERFLIWPTTRQGDQLNERCERFFRMMETASNRIGLLESQMNMQHDNINDAVNESIDALEKKVREQGKKIAALEKEIYETTFS